MDLDEWELLPDDGFLEIHDDGGKKIFSRKYGNDLKNVFENNHFICPSQKSSQFVESTKQLLPLQIHVESTIKKIHDHEVCIRAPVLGNVQADRDQISQVFFKKMKENEFADMKVESPKPKMDDDKEKMIKKDKMDLEIKDDVPWEENSGGFNILKWRLSGVGAICSFGVAAATMCIIIFGGRQKNCKQHHQHPQKIQFHIYSDDKRMKQVVHQASRLNESISSVRGVPDTRAHFSFDGYFDGF